jgi:ABC-type nitrate/sulfonate/bicarbonate transport system permease component
MVVRIRFGKGPKVGKKRQKNRRLALALSALLPPAAFLAGVLGAWRIAADLNWTNSFAIPSGIFSHWQVWLGAAIGLQMCARYLNRYGRSNDPAAS